jgi:hypothetical protein
MATMVHEGLFVGSAADTYKFAGSILHCARDPWFEDAIMRLRHPIDYSDYGITISGNEHHSGLFARISCNELALNLVDADNPMYFPDEVINAGLDFITERMAEGDVILCHCNMGISRSPSVAMLWMFEHGFLDDEFRYAVPQFKQIYKDWCPGNGIWQYLKKRCDKE